MKKIYVLVVVCFLISFPAFSQTFYWIGAPNGDWENASNWSLSLGGTPASEYPSDNSDNAIFPADAQVLFNTTISINSLSVTTASANVKITGTGGTDRFLTLTGSSLSQPALKIAAGSTLEQSATTNTWFRVIFGNDAVADINGDWVFTGDIDDNAIASFFLGDPGFNTVVNINSGGSLTVGSKGFIEPNETTGDAYLKFNSGSALKLLGNAPVVPAADYNTSSVIEITGVVDASVIFEEAGSVGSITYNCPAQANGSNHLYLSLLAFVVKGDVNILNTNNNELTLINFNSSTGMTSRDATIKGKLNIQGNSNVAVAHNDGYEFANNLFVEGDLVMNGNNLNIHAGNYISTLATTLHVKGNIVHTSGTIGSSSTSVNEQAHLFVIELNGSTQQTISSHNGNFDNAQNQVTLRVNNASGISLLTDLQVGRLSFNSSNKGILTTGTHKLYVSNKTASSVSTLVVESASTNGYVYGNIRRRSSYAESMLMPVGDAANYRGFSIIPSSADLSIYDASFINSDHGGTMIAPVRGIANYYWTINRVGAGADAAIQLSIPAQLPNALTGYDIAVTRYDGSNWISTKGTTGLVVSPGTSSSGTVRSSVQSQFGVFTISLESEGALPTYLASFNIRKVEKSSALIEWQITDNSTPDQFDIERSSDGVQFRSIGTLKSRTSQTEYTYTDAAMMSGNNYYRLKMIDKDGSTNFSVIKVLMTNVQGVVLHSLAPSMVTTSTRMRITAEAKANARITVTDINGRILQTRNIIVFPGTQDILLDASQLSVGTFNVTAYTQGGKSATLRFIKL